MAGNTRKPEEARRLEGYPDHRPPRAPVIVGGKLDEQDLATLRAPKYFSALEREAWREILRELVAGRIVDRVDLTIVEAAAVMLGRARQARQTVNAEGLTGINSQGRVGSPFVSIERESWKEYRQLAQVLGIGAANRAGLGAKGAKTPGSADPLESRLPPPGRLSVMAGGRGDAD